MKELEGGRFACGPVPIPGVFGAVVACRRPGLSGKVISIPEGDGDPNRGEG